jgi:hypothetical protein
MTYSGQVQYACTSNSAKGITTIKEYLGAIYKSTNYGTTWNRITLPTTTINGEWIQIQYTDLSNNPQSYSITGYTITTPFLIEGSGPPSWTLVGAKTVSGPWYEIHSVSDYEDPSIQWSTVLPIVNNTNDTDISGANQTTFQFQKTPTYSVFRLLMGPQGGITGIGKITFDGIPSFPLPTYDGSGNFYNSNGVTITGNRSNIIQNTVTKATVSTSWDSTTINTMEAYVERGYTWKQYPLSGILCTNYSGYLCYRSLIMKSTITTSVLSPYSLENSWTSITTSSDGKYITAVYTDVMGLSSYSPSAIPNKIAPPSTIKGGMMRSDDYGVSWSITTAPTYEWVKTVMSSDGIKQLAIAYDTSGNSKVNTIIDCLYLTTNGTSKTSNWTPLHVPVEVSASSATMSGNGSTIVAISKHNTKNVAIYTVATADRKSVV